MLASPYGNTLWQYTQPRRIMRHNMSMSAPHFAKNVFFGCIDDRLVKSHQEFVTKIGGAFPSSIAGGGLAFVSPAERDIALKQVSLSYAINHVNHVYLESHTDCGAYTVAGITFDTPEEEVDRLYHDLGIAASAAKTALLQAGAMPNEVVVTVRVVDPEGRIIPRQRVPVLQT